MTKLVFCLSAIALLSLSIALFYNATITGGNVMITGGPKPLLVLAYKSPNNIGSSGGTTATADFTLVGGDTLIAVDYACSSTSCAAPGAKPNFTGVTGPGIGTCAFILGTRSIAGQVGAAFLGTEAWWCPITASGTNIAVTVTAHWASKCFFCTFSLLEVRGLSGSPDSGIGNTAFSASQAVNIATARGTDGRYNMVIFSELPTTDVTLGSGETLIFDDFDNTGWVMSYKINNSSKAIVSGNTQSSSNNWNASAAALHVP